jgi:hypothetical protein
MWTERARALPVRGQGFSHLEQQLQRTDTTSLFPAGQADLGNEGGCDV